jgi:hypothetical protein
LSRLRALPIVASFDHLVGSIYVATRNQVKALIATLELQGLE